MSSIKPSQVCPHVYRGARDSTGAIVRVLPVLGLTLGLLSYSSIQKLFEGLDLFVSCFRPYSAMLGLLQGDPGRPFIDGAEDPPQVSCVHGKHLSISPAP